MHRIRTMCGAMESFRAMGLALLVAACGRGEALGPSSQDALGLSFEETPQPEIFVREGVAVRAGAGAAEGMWAVVADLPRPERAEVLNLSTGARATVALFQGSLDGEDAEVQLSAAAADAIGVGEQPEVVRVTALRREPRLRERADVF